MTPSPGENGSDSPHEVALERQKHLKEAARQMSAAATALGPLTRSRTYESLDKAAEALARVEKKIGREAAKRTGADGVLDDVRAWIDHSRNEMARGLGSKLKAACQEAGLELRVVSREEPVEIRIPPLSVAIDRTRGEAEFRFARQTLATCRADADEIVGVHRKVLKTLDTAVKPPQFFDRCLAAWRAARASREGSASDRVEILTFLPFLALQMQSSKFRVDPASRNYKGYSRAQFAYDVLRLRRAGKLSHEGMRINFGVATGTTATQKQRVIYLEDEHGIGEYKLTVYFTRQDRDDKR